MNVIYSLDEKHIAQLHELYQQEWWSKDRTIFETRKCVSGSQVCVGLVDGQNNLIGFARVLTDYIFKALIFDLIVQKNERGSGFGEKLISFVKLHSQLQGVKHFELYCLPEMFSFYIDQGFSTEVGEVRLMRQENSLRQYRETPIVVP